MASTQNRLAGTAYISVDGVVYEVAGNLTWNSVTTVKETLKSMSDPAPGYRELPTAAWIDLETRDLGDVPLSTFQNMTNSTVVVQLANSKVLTGTSMWTTEAFSVNEQEGTFRLRFEGGNVTETTA